MPKTKEQLISKLRALTPDQLERLSDDDRHRIFAFLGAVAYDHLDSLCANDPLYWAQNHTATEDPHYLERGKSFIAPFPKKDYFVPLFQAFQKHARLFIPKTREMLTSWAVMVYGTHRAQWQKAEVIVQTANEEKAKRLVEYATILYRNQAEWLKARHPLKGSSVLSIEWADGGKIFGIPSGEDKVRMWHPTLMVFDEAAFLPGAEECYNAVNPVAKQVIAISSAGPGWFADECSL